MRLVLIPICVKVVQILSPFDVVLENTCLSFQFFPMFVCWQAPFFRSGLYREELPCSWR